MTNSSVEFRGLSKSYSQQMVIKDLSLALPANVTSAIVGESGSGKSTLLQIINGLVRPDQGDILIDGTALDYTNLSEVRRRMGYAVQGAGLFPHMTVRENVALIAGLDGWTAAEIQSRYVHLMELLELPLDFSDRFPHSLSGGQQQRVSLCRAMMLDPPLLLLDEPFSALDPITRASIHDEFIKLQEEKTRSIILVTHDMREAMKLAAYLVVLKEGLIVQSGAFEEVRQNPVDDYVTRLFAGAAS